MTGVHIIALISALVTLSLIVELSRRQAPAREVRLHVAGGRPCSSRLFAIFPGLFNSVAHGVA